MQTGDGMSSHHDVLIVGSGHAGAQAAIALRRLGFTGTVALAGEEAELPYERPPLSKEYLSGDRPFDRMLLRQAAFWPSADIALLAGRKAVHVDPPAHAVTFADGEVATYGRLVWAAGGDARRLSCHGHDLSGVHSVRSRADVDQLLRELPDVRHVAVVGGGFIGMEAAAVLTKLGRTVTLLEAQSRVLARVCGDEIARFYEAEHRAHGVDLRTGTTVASIEARDGERVGGVGLESGEVIACDMVIVGIGIVPAIEPLRAAGAARDGGVLVDRAARTSLADVYAVGDCAVRPSDFAQDGGPIRIESVQNAGVMALAAAADITGAVPDKEPVPWFWSNQFDLRMQTAGIATGHDRTAVRGDPSARSFAVAYFQGDRLLACDCVNAAKLFGQAKRMLADGAHLDAAIFANASRPIEEAIRSPSHTGHGASG